MLTRLTELIEALTFSPETEAVSCFNECSQHDQKKGDATAPFAAHSLQLLVLVMDFAL